MQFVDAPTAQIARRGARGRGIQSGSGPARRLAAQAKESATGPARVAAALADPLVDAYPGVRGGTKGKTKSECAKSSANGIQDEPTDMAQNA